MKAGMQKYIEMHIIKKELTIFQTAYENKQEHNTSTKKTTEGDLKKELEKMRNDIKKIKKRIMNKK